MILEPILIKYNLVNRQMSKSINEKRQQLREEIRKKEREQFFMKGRMKMLETYRHQSSIPGLMNNLQNRTNLPETFQQLTKIIGGANYFADIMQMIQKGLISISMTFFRDNICLKETLQLVSFLFTKMKQKEKVQIVDIFERYYNQGILQYLLLHLKDQHQATSCAYLLSLFSQNKEDYCEALAYGNGYKALIEQFYRLQKVPSQQIQNNPEYFKGYIYLIHTLENIVMMRDTALDLQIQKSQIFNFIVGILQKGLFPQSALGVFYECLKNINKNLGQSYTDILNHYARQASPDCDYLHNLLACVYLMSPHPSINYAACFNAAVREPNRYRLLSLVMQKVMTEKQLVAAIPTDEVCWQRLLIHPTDEETFKRFIRIASRLALNRDVYWRIIGTSLDPQSSIGVQKEVLYLVDEKVRKAEQEPNLVDLLKRHRIHYQLQKLSNLSKNQLLKDKAMNLLNYITGPFADMMERIE